MQRIAAIQAQVDAIIEAKDPPPDAAQRAVDLTGRSPNDPQPLSSQELREICSALSACPSDDATPKSDPA